MVIPEALSARSISVVKLVMMVHFREHQRKESKGLGETDTTNVQVRIYFLDQTEAEWRLNGSISITSYRSVNLASTLSNRSLITRSPLSN
jgi:hypothetical protein